MHARHQEMLADIAALYYLDNASKVEIARARGISRFQVARYLDEAKREGIVSITIHRPHLAAAGVEGLADALGVLSVTVSRQPQPGGDARETLARAAAGVLADLARPGCTIGVSWSRTLNLMASHLPDLPGCDVVQLAGDLSIGNDGGSGQLLHRLGMAAGGRTWPLPAPLLVESAATAASLRRQPEISAALERADSLDIAVVALGTWADGHSTVWERVAPSERLAAARAGAVGECSGRLIAADGSAVGGELDDRVIAVELDQLRKTPSVIAVARGRDGLAAVMAAVHGGLVNHLVVDEPLAAALLEKLGTTEGTA